MYPISKNYLFYYPGYPDLGSRYLGEKYPQAGSTSEHALNVIRDRHFQLAHRHKIALVDGNTASMLPLLMLLGPSGPPLKWKTVHRESRLRWPRGSESETAYSRLAVMAVGTGKNGGEPAMWAHWDGWVNWFQSHAPDTEYFLI